MAKKSSLIGLCALATPDQASGTYTFQPRPKTSGPPGQPKAAVPTRVLYNFGSTIPFWAWYLPFRSA
jgi:hypothetical protein